MSKTKEKNSENKTGIFKELYRLLWSYKVKLNGKIVKNQDLFYNFITNDWNAGKKGGEVGRAFDDDNLSGNKIDYASYFYSNKAVEKSLQGQYHDRNDLIESLKNGFAEIDKRDAFLEDLKDILSKEDLCYKKKKDYVKYDTTELISFIEKAKFDLSYYFYLCMHLATLKRLPDNYQRGLSYGRYRKEFDEKVIDKHGANSVPGMNAIYALTKGDDPNPIALFERAEINYYGRLNGKPNKAEAFKYYKCAAGLASVREGHMVSEINPLGLWGVAYVYFNYKSGNDLLECDKIDEIDSVMEEDNKSGNIVKKRIVRAIQYAYKSVKIEENGPAVNLLGKIVEIMDEDTKEEYQKYFDNESDDLKSMGIKPGEIKLKDKKEYFETAIKYDYIFAYNNMSTVYLYRTEDEKYKKEIFENEKNCLKYLKIAADKCEPWAANGFARACMQNVISYKNVIHHINSSSLKKILIELNNWGDIDDIEYEKKRKALASEYYEVSVEGNNYSSPWAMVNYILDFPDTFHNNKGTEIKGELIKLVEGCCINYSNGAVAKLCRGVAKSSVYNIKEKSYIINSVFKYIKKQRPGDEVCHRAMYNIGIMMEELEKFLKEDEYAKYDELFKKFEKELDKFSW